MAVWIVPGLEPLILGVVEGVNGMWVSVGPWLSALTLWPVVISSTNSDVEDEIVLLIEWSALLGLILPWVVDFWVESSLGEHVLVEWEIENFLSVKCGNDVLISPLETIKMEIISEGS